VAENGDAKSVVMAFWKALYARDFEHVAAFFDERSTYTDIATPAEDLAIGPRQIVARLELGIQRLASYDHTLIAVIADGAMVVTEHVEHWTWPTGEQISFGFVSVHEVVEETILRWTDYWDLQTLLSAAPAWWIEEIAAGYQ
jgi:limonene-1,2-epoxide hydrolase